jgi:hypothetical protein
MVRHVVLLVAVAVAAAVTGVSTAAIVPETSPQAQLSDALAVLTAVHTRPGRQKPGKMLELAIADLQAGLDPSLWTDGSHVDPQQGHKVYDDLAGAVGKLGLVDDAPPEVPESAATIARVAVELTQITYGDLEAALDGPPPVDVQIALDQMAADIAQAQDALQSGDLGTAVREASTGQAVGRRSYKPFIIRK